MPKTPSYRNRKDRAQALVTLTDSETGRRRDFWLGEFGSRGSRERYHRLIAEWESAGRRLPEGDFDRPAGRGVSCGGPTVAEMLAQFWRWAKANHAPKQQQTFRPLIGLLNQMAGSTPAAEFGPTRLRQVREAMIRGDATAERPRKPWSRPYVNNQIKRARLIFKWAASHELIPVSVHQTLAAVEPLRRGRTIAREPDRVGPAPMGLVEAARPFMSRQARALVDLQLLTGARPGELLGMRAIDLDMDAPGGVWTLTPRDHKSAHRGRDRIIYLGPKAQSVIREFLQGRSLDAPLFSPSEADVERRAERSAARKTPLSCGNREGTNRRETPRKRPLDRYAPASYYRAIQYACDRAFPPPPPLGRQQGESKAAWAARLSDRQKADLKGWRAAHRFHPYQLRHSAATAIRREFGLEAAQLALGHASAAITDAVYAERDATKVIDLMRRVG